MGAEFPIYWTKEQINRFSRLEPLFGHGLYDKYPMVHVAGTNGKGSICAYLDSILTQQGYKTGLFTSPHLYDHTERIRVSGENIPESELIRLLNEAQQKLPDALYFERYFYAALMWFELQKVDIAVIETGVGGALDATSIIKPNVTVTATVGFDHMQTLGKDIASIAKQKAGIAKAGVPMVLYPVQEQETREVFFSECKKAGAPLYDLQNVKINSVREGMAQTVEFELFGGKITSSISLLGKYQAFNATTAAYAAFLLKKDGIEVSQDSIKKGLENARWAGRFERIAESPDIYIDGAHNVEGVLSLYDTVKEYLPDKKIIAVTAMMREKEAWAMAKVIDKMAHKVICTLADTERGIKPNELSGFFGDAIPIADPKDAMRLAREICPEDGVILVCGSLYLPQFIR